MSEITPTRRTVIRTAAWSVPAVSLAAAAPAFAVSPPDAPDLSTSSLNTAPVTRNGKVVTIPPLLIHNTGTQNTGDVNFAIITSEPVTRAQIHVPFGPPGGSTVDVGPSFTTVPSPALPSDDFNFTFISFSDLAPGTSMSAVASLIFTFDTEEAVDIQIALLAGNGGVGWNSGVINVPGTPPNLGTTTLPTPVRDNNKISLAPFLIQNTGGTNTTGLIWDFTTSGANITRIEAFNTNVNGFSGITVTGADTPNVQMVFPPNFFGPNGNAPAGGSMNTFVTLDLIMNTVATTDLDVSITANSTPSESTPTPVGVPVTGSFNVASPPPV